MNPIYYFDAALVIIVVIAITDANVAPWLGLQFKVLTIEMRRQWLLLMMKPDLWFKKGRIKRFLKKLQQDQELQAIIKEQQENEK